MLLSAAPHIFAGLLIILHLYHGRGRRSRRRCGAKLRISITDSWRSLRWSAARAPGSAGTQSVHVALVCRWEGDQAAALSDGGPRTSTSAPASQAASEREQVYYISKGKVKLANRAYASVKNDYTISLDGRCQSLYPMRQALFTPLSTHWRPARPPDTGLLAFLHPQSVQQRGSSVRLARAQVDHRGVGGPGCVAHAGQAFLRAHRPDGHVHQQQGVSLVLSVRRHVAPSSRDQDIRYR